MPGLGIDAGVKTAVEAAIRTNVADAIGQTLDQEGVDAAVAATVATLQTLQSTGVMPFDPMWSVSVDLEGTITIRWAGLDELVVQ